MRANKLSYLLYRLYPVIGCSLLQITIENKYIIIIYIDLSLLVKNEYKSMKTFEMKGIKLC